VNSTAHVERIHTRSAKLARGGGAAIIIGLNVIKSEAGDRWEKMRDTIYARLEILFRQKLGPSDFFIPIDEVSYLVAMPEASFEDAKVCGLRVAYELHTSLLGRCTIEQLQIASAAAASDDVLDITPIVFPEIRRLAERAQLNELLAPKPRGEHAATPPLLVPQTKFMTVASSPREDVQHQYVPIWDARNQVISTYRCVLKPSALAFPSDAINVKAKKLLALSLTTLNCAISGLAAHLDRGDRFVVNIPISYEALSTPVARMEIVAACRQLPCELRPYLVFEITELPAGTPHSRLIDLVSAVKAFARGVIGQVPRLNPSLSTYEGTGLQALGLKLPSPPNANIDKEIERLCAAAKRFGMSTFLEDIPTAGMVQFALTAGVQWMSGPAIAGPVTEPCGITRLFTESLLNNPGATSQKRHNHEHHCYI